MTARFSVEKTLGKLAKWLRILGFDACSEPRGSIGSK
ncbi:MAG: Mut7-C RNAse domain-containing protein, partial [Desulfobacterales bacterium]